MTCKEWFKILLGIISKHWLLPKYSCVTIFLALSDRMFKPNVMIVATANDAEVSKGKLVCVWCVSCEGGDCIAVQVLLRNFE